MFVLMFRLQKYYKKMEYTRLWTKIIMLAFFLQKKETPKGLLSCLALRLFISFLRPVR